MTHKARCTSKPSAASGQNVLQQQVFERTNRLSACGRDCWLVH